MDGSFKIGLKLNLGNYSSIDIEVIGINAKEARDMITSEIDETLKMAKECMVKASK